MKTYETLEGKFVSEDPGLENTIFGRDNKGTPIVLNSILYCDYSPGECYFTKITGEYEDQNYINYYIKHNYLVISARLASIISKNPNRRIYGKSSL